MGYRSRSYSRSRSRSRSPGGKRADTPMRREPANRCSLLIRNIAKSVIADDLKFQAEKFGVVRDVYLPKDYYTGDPRGIGFVEFTNSRDAEEAKYGMDRLMLQGRELSVCFAQQGRKRPEEYRRGPPRGGRREYGGGGGSYRDSGYRDSYRDSGYRDSYRDNYRDSYRDSYKRRSRSRTPPRRDYSPSPRRARSPSRSPRRSASPPRQYRRSPSPMQERERSPPPREYSRSPPPPRASGSPVVQDRSPERD